MHDIGPQMFLPQVIISQYNKLEELLQIKVGHEVFLWEMLLFKANSDDTSHFFTVPANSSEVKDKLHS